MKNLKGRLGIRLGFNADGEVVMLSDVEWGRPDGSAV